MNLSPIEECQKGYQCEVLADSVSEHNPVARLTTMRWKYPLIVHAEACRHRAFSRSVSSNRAIPTERIMQMVEEDPFVPERFPINRPGMQATEYYEAGSEGYNRCQEAWLEGRKNALRTAREMLSLGVHKQIANRVLMPYQWVTEVVSATDWANFFALRCHPMAQGEIRTIADLAHLAYQASKPVVVAEGEWHLPFITDTEAHVWNAVPLFAAMEGFFERVQAISQKLVTPYWISRAVSAARVARTSYRTHDGRLSTMAEDMELYLRLTEAMPRHMSPTEHQATPTVWKGGSGNFRGWIQHRSFFPDECIYHLNKNLLP